MNRVRAIIDPMVPPGTYRIGSAARIVTGDDATLGREIRAVEVGCPDSDACWRLRDLVEADADLEMDDG
jgi:hypothetical protein